MGRVVLATVGMVAAAAVIVGIMSCGRGDTVGRWRWNLFGWVPKNPTCCRMIASTFLVFGTWQLPPGTKPQRKQSFDDDDNNGDSDSSTMRIPWLLPSSFSSSSTTTPTNGDTNRTSHNATGSTTHGITTPTMDQVFSDTYLQARTRFRTAAARIGICTEALVVVVSEEAAAAANGHDTVATKPQSQRNVEQHNNPDIQMDDSCRNDDDDSLLLYTMDIAVIPGRRPGIVVHVSGTHGVEGYAGSAIQLAFLAALEPNAKSVSYSSSSTLQSQQHETQDTSRSDSDASCDATTTTTTNPNSCSSNSTTYPRNVVVPLDDVCTVVLVHAFNPYGMAWYRRVNENNVDLNRNGLLDHEWPHMQHPQPHWNMANFDAMARTLLNPIATTPTTTSASTTSKSWFSFVSPSWRLWWKVHVTSWWHLIVAVMRLGGDISTLKRAMVGGQYHQPTAIFYGGNTTEPSLLLLRDWMQTFLLQQQQESSPTAAGTGPTTVTIEMPSITWIDVHTGLGVMGVDTLLQTARNNNNNNNGVGGVTHQHPDAAELKQWFPESASNDASQVSKGYEQVTGLTIDYYQQQLNLTDTEKHWFLVQEFGTIPAVQTGHALVVENAVYHDVTVSAMERQFWSRYTLGTAFAPPYDSWRRQVLHRGLLCLQRAMQRSMAAMEGY